MDQKYFDIVVNLKKKKIILSEYDIQVMIKSLIIRITICGLIFLLKMMKCINYSSQSLDIFFKLN